jgi:hypothetical protein
MSDETPVLASLAMDRGEPLGNSEDNFGRRALHTKIGNSTSEPIPVTNAGIGAELFISAETTTTPGVQQTLITYAIPSGKQLNALQLVITCNYEGAFYIYKDIDLVGSGRTGAAAKNVSFTWLPYLIFEYGSSLVVKFNSVDYRPAASVEAHLQGRLITL